VNRPLQFSSRLLVLAVAVLAAGPGGSRADIGSALARPNPDDEFARAADLLEAGRRSEAEAVLAEIHDRVHQPAWDVRAAFLLAQDDAGRGRLSNARERLAAVDARPIGLEPYRLLALARWDEAAQHTGLARSEARAAFEWPTPFAFRHRAGALLADLLEAGGRLPEALAVREQAAALAPAEEALSFDLARVRLALRLGDRGAVDSAARHLWIVAPESWSARGLPAAFRAAGVRVQSSFPPEERLRIGQALLDAGDARDADRMFARTAAGTLPAELAADAILGRVRALSRLHKWAAAARQGALLRRPPDALEAERLVVENRLARYQKRHGRRTPPGIHGPFDPRRPEIDRVARTLDRISRDSEAREETRRAALEREVMLIAADEQRWDEAAGVAERLARIDPDTRSGFEALWLGAWGDFGRGDIEGAIGRIDRLRTIYSNGEPARQLDYWKARCLETAGKVADARAIYRQLCATSTDDVYGLFARGRLPDPPAVVPQAQETLPEVSAGLRRVDELLRLRLFEEARAEARRAPPCRERSARLALAEFALGNFGAAARWVKSAFPEIGTAEERLVPDEWRRLYYPVEPEGLVKREAVAARLDPAVVRALVRQESTFRPNVRSAAGAVGMMQLLPRTARRLTRSVLKRRFHVSFLYDPGINVRLGTSYLRQLQDRFGGDMILTLAAYNAGPDRLGDAVVRGLPDDVRLETIPFAESRQYVRHILLFASSYRELYPEEPEAPEEARAGGG
jgi:soluble lytic murein transglycosylase-like protein